MKKEGRFIVTPIIFVKAYNHKKEKVKRGKEIDFFFFLGGGGRSVRERERGTSSGSLL